MNRRGFIGALIAGAVLDSERLLWRAGERLISIPAAPKVVVPDEVMMHFFRAAVETLAVEIDTEVLRHYYRITCYFKDGPVVTMRSTLHHGTMRLPSDAGSPAPYSPT